MKKYTVYYLNTYKQGSIEEYWQKIEAESADISSLNWELKNVKIIDNDGKILSDNVENISYTSIYDLDKIKSLYSNLETVSFWKIGNSVSRVCFFFFTN